MINENQVNNRLNERQYLLRIFLRIYFIILFVSTVIGLSFSRQFGLILIFSLVSSLVVFICCNCGQCFKTRVISGTVLVGPSNLSLRSGLQQDQQIAYIIVSPRTMVQPIHGEDSPEPLAQAVAPLYPVYGPNHNFQPPPTYEESERQYK